jgi:hypothetical protein
LVSCEDALEAEIQACFEGLMLSLQYSQLPIIIDTGLLPAGCSGP